MKKNNLDHADMVFLTFLDKMCVHLPIGQLSLSFMYYAANSL